MFTSNTSNTPLPSPADRLVGADLPFGGLHCRVGGLSESVKWLRRDDHLHKALYTLLIWSVRGLNGSVKGPIGYVRELIGCVRGLNGCVRGLIGCVRELNGSFGGLNGCVKGLNWCVTGLNGCAGRTERTRQRTDQWIRRLNGSVIGLSGWAFPSPTAVRCRWVRRLVTSIRKLFRSFRGLSACIRRGNGEVLSRGLLRMHDMDRQLAHPLPYPWQRYTAR